jgi:hypothetical protein
MFLLKLFSLLLIVLGLMIYAISFSGYLPGLMSCCIHLDPLPSPLEHFDTDAPAGGVATGSYRLPQKHSSEPAQPEPIENALTAFLITKKRIAHWPAEDTKKWERAYTRKTLTPEMRKEGKAYIDAIFEKAPSSSSSESSSPLGVEIISIVEEGYEDGQVFRKIKANVHMQHLFVSGIVNLVHVMPGDEYEGSAGCC